MNEPVKDCFEQKKGILRRCYLLFHLNILAVRRKVLQQVQQAKHQPIELFESVDIEEEKKSTIVNLTFSYRMHTDQ